MEALKKRHRILTLGKWRVNISVFWAWYDGWVGYYWDSLNWTLYICPIPWLVFRFDTKMTGAEFVEALEKSPLSDESLENMLEDLE